MAAHAWKIITNMERMKRGFTNNPYCYCCTEEREDLNHIFRFCTKSKSFWIRSVKDEFRKSRYILPFTDWLYWNPKVKSQSDKGPWRERFSISLWWLWEWRNKLIFANKRTSVERKADMVRNKFLETLAAFSNEAVVLGRYDRPRLGWVEWNRPSK